MAEPITSEQLAEWRALLAKATPGPWKVAPDFTCLRIDAPGTNSRPVDVVARLPKLVQVEANAAFIAASPAIVSALLDEVERLRAVMADSLTIEPCHITGMHAPNHHTDYLCAEQMREAWMRLVMAMGLVPESEAGEDVNTYNRRKLRTLHQQLPRRNHDESCYWCEKNGDGWHEVQP